MWCACWPIASFMATVIMSLWFDQVLYLPCISGMTPMSNIPSSRKRQGPQSATAGRVHGALRPDVDVELGWESVSEEFGVPPLRHPCRTS